MKKIFFPALLAALVALGATDASAQSKKNDGVIESDIERPMPSNSEIAPSKELPRTDGRPMEQIRVNETDSQRNRNAPQSDVGEAPSKATQTQPAIEGRPVDAIEPVDPMY